LWPTFILTTLTLLRKVTVLGTTHYDRDLTVYYILYIRPDSQNYKL